MHGLKSVKNKKVGNTSAVSGHGRKEKASDVSRNRS